MRVKCLTRFSLRKKIRTRQWSCSRAHVVGNCQYTITPARERLKLFSTIIFVNQLSLWGAVPEMCEECESCPDRTGRPVVERQSNSLFVPNLMKTNMPLTDDPAQEVDLLQRYRERIEKLSQQDKLSKFCMDARFLDNSWGRTVLHDKRHWIILTIHRFSGLSWVHVAKRRRLIWTKTLDQMEHQNWTRTGSHNQPFAR